MRIGSQLKCHPKKCQQDGFPKSLHIHIAKKREVIQTSISNNVDAAPQYIRLEPNVGVRENQPFTARHLIRFLQSVWFAEPSWRKLSNMHGLKIWMSRGKFIQNARS